VKPLPDLKCCLGSSRDHIAIKQVSTIPISLIPLDDKNSQATLNLANLIMIIETTYIFFTMRSRVDVLDAIHALRD
jgi:hypothetical protein